MAALAFVLQQGVNGWEASLGARLAESKKAQQEREATHSQGRRGKFHWKDCGNEGVGRFLLSNREVRVGQVGKSCMKISAM